MSETPLTPQQFSIELGELRATIGVVQREHAAITASMEQIKVQFGKVGESWDTPASASYEDVRLWLERAATELEELLAEMGRRMQRAYDNYQEAETLNVHNLSSNSARENGR